MIRRLAGVVASAAVIAALAGCVAIPTSGTLSEHGFRGIEDQPDVTFDAPGPAKGATAEEILEGFIRAGVDVKNRYATAREFLTGDLAGKWNPSASVLVTDGSQNRIETIGTTVSSLEVQIAARIDSIGQYSSTAEPVSTALSFSFRRVRGEWRISAAPDATVLSPYNFQALFDAYPLYFIDPTRSYLVPDLRWFPSDDATPERIVRALLAGPAPWLGSGAVLSSFAKGTQLDGRVEISQGTATVDLSSDVLGEDATTRRGMVAQLKASLDEVATITGVELMARGFPVPISGGNPPPVLPPQVSSLPVGATATAIGTVGASGVRPLALSDAAIALGPRGGTVDRGLTTLALLTGTGSYRVSDSGEPALVDRRGAQIAPSLDPLGSVWTAQSGGLGTLRATDSRGETRDVAPSSATTGALTAFRISRDGSRIAVVLASDDGPSVMVGAIQRDSSLAPTGIGPMISIPVRAEAVIDLAWSDPVSLALLIRQDGEVRVVNQQVGGTATDLGRPGEGIQIVGGNAGADGLRILTSDGTLLQQTGTGGWQETGAGGLSFLVVQQ